MILGQTKISANAVTKVQTRSFDPLVYINKSLKFLIMSVNHITTNIGVLYFCETEVIVIVHVMPLKSTINSTAL